MQYTMSLNRQVACYLKAVSHMLPYTVTDDHFCNQLRLLGIFVISHCVTHSHRLTLQHSRPAVAFH